VDSFPAHLEKGRGKIALRLREWLEAKEARKAVVRGEVSLVVKRSSLAKHDEPGDWREIYVAIDQLRNAEERTIR